MTLGLFETHKRLFIHHHLAQNPSPFLIYLILLAMET